MKHTFYDTTAMSMFNQTKTIKALELANIKGEIDYIHIEGQSVGVLSPANKTVDVFMHPITLYQDSKDTTSLTIIDPRPYARRDANNELSIQMLLLRTALDDIWKEDGGPSTLLGLSKLPMLCMSRVLSSIITQKFGLDPESRMRIEILTAFFYWSSFKSEDLEVDGEVDEKAVSAISNSMGIGGQRVMDVLSGLDYIRDLDGYCTVLRERVGDVRLDRMNTPILITMIGNTWWGNGARELMVASLEYPPAWIAIVVVAITARRFRRTPIAEQIQTVRKELERQDYSRSVSNLTQIQRLMAEYNKL